MRQIKFAPNLALNSNHMATKEQIIHFEGKTMAHNKDQITLYSYFRSSASYRVRAALNLKQIPYEISSINLKTGEHLLPETQKLSSFCELPILEHNGNQIAQSMAIVLYLEESFPETKKLLPQLAFDKAIVIQMCEAVNSGIHPVQNLKVGKKLKSDHEFSQDQVIAWNKHWVELGFSNLEKLLSKYCGDFCWANEVTIADLFLAPQVYNALRFKVDISKYSNISRIYQNCLDVPEIKSASPGFQDDTPDDLKGHINP